MKIRIGTRKSKLALLQTEIVINEIKKYDADIEIEIIPISTKGDENLDKSLLKIGGKGVFTKELEEAILEKKIDMAVHSAKDMPMEFADGLSILPVLCREDARDVFVSTCNIKLEKLKNGKIIGTGSLRRSLQVLNINPDLKIKDLRGNIQTRIEKLKTGLYDGIILAAAGIERLKRKFPDIFKDLYLEYLDTDIFVPAAAQGILALEFRKGEYSALISRLKNKYSYLAFEAERIFLKTLGAGCNAPCGIYLEKTCSAEYLLKLMIERSGNLEYKIIQVEEKNAVELAKKLAREYKNNER